MKKYKVILSSVACLLLYCETQAHSLQDQSAQRNPKTQTNAQNGLMDAVSKHDLAAVRALLDKGVDVNSRFQYEETALMTASVIGSIEIVSLLIERGADVNARNKNGMTALMRTITFDVVKLLVEKGADVNLRSEIMGKTALILAANGGRVEAVRYFLSKGADANPVDGLKMNALMFAAQSFSDKKNGDIQVFQELLSKTKDIDAKDTMGKTALIYARGSGNVQFAELLKKGAAREPSALETLKDAVDRDDAATVRRLIGRVTDEKSKNELFFKAATFGHLQVLEFFLASGTRVNLKDSTGDTALILAATHERRNLVTTLLNKGADVNAQNNNGETALMWAAMVGEKSIVQALLAKGANVATKSKAGDTALSLAVGANQTEISALLKKAGAKQ